MPSFNPFSTVTGKHAASLFEIRLDNDFIVFRGGEDESAGQILRGQVVLCLPTPLKIEDVHLRLTGALRLSWDYSKTTASGISSQKVDKTTTLLQHRWAPFVGGTGGKNTILPAGNYEWPFEFTLPGNTAESVEGIPEASITYKLKATVARGKLAYDLHAYKALRIIRTLEPAALEFLHAMSVENIWPNKVDYSIIIPQKAVVFGANSRFEQQYQHGKTLDSQAKDEDGRVKAYNKTVNTKVAKPGKRDDPSETYGGRPRETRGWHEGAAEQRMKASAAWKETAEARQTVAKNFIGYDGLQGHRGHQERIRNCNKWAAEHEQKANDNHLKDFR